MSNHIHYLAAEATDCQFSGEIGEKPINTAQSVSKTKEKGENHSSKVRKRSKTLTDFALFGISLTIEIAYAREI